MTQKKPQRTTALATIPKAKLEAASRSVSALAELFGEDGYNLLAPVVHMALPKGMRLAISVVNVSPEIDRYGSGDDVVKISGGKLLVLRHKLDQIAAAGGISWTKESVDSSLHPHYVKAEVHGLVTDYDGTVRKISGSKVIDTRADIDGAAGPDLEEILEKARDKNRDPTKQIRELRKFATEIAPSKARNRAIAQAFGIKRSYTPAELAKPFVIPKLVLDPDDKDARELVMANAAGATDALYGAKAQAGPPVVDVPFEEAEPDAAEPATDTEPAHDPETGETLAPEKVLEACYNQYRQAGGARDDFQALYQKATGLDGREGLDDVQAENLQSAVRAFIANKDAGDCPV
jgi:hypothetical protein